MHLSRPMEHSMIRLPPPSPANSRRSASQAHCCCPTGLLRFLSLSCSAYMEHFSIPLLLTATHSSSLRPEEVLTKPLK